MTVAASEHFSFRFFLFDVVWKQRRSLFSPPDLQKISRPSFFSNEIFVLEKLPAAPPFPYHKPPFPLQTETGFRPLFFWYRHKSSPLFPSFLLPGRKGVNRGSSPFSSVFFFLRCLIDNVTLRVDSPFSHSVVHLGEPLPFFSFFS